MKRKGFTLLCMLTVALMLLFPAVHSAVWEYSIDKIRLTDLSGREVTDYKGGSCMVEVSYTRNVYDEIGYVIITGYSDTGTLISFNYVKTTEKDGVFATLVKPSEGENIGRIKAYVWESVNTMESLAEARSIVLDADCPDIFPEAENFVTFDPKLLFYIENTGDNEGEIYVRKAKNTNNCVSYHYRDASLYVNGAFFCNVSDEREIRDLIRSSTGDVRLFENPDCTGYYSHIMIDVYTTALIQNVVHKEGSTEIFLSDIYNPVQSGGNYIKVSNDDLADGNLTVSVNKNGKQCKLTDIVKGDIISIKHNICTDLKNSEFYCFELCDKRITASFDEYDAEDKTFCLSGEKYPGIDIDYDWTTTMDMLFGEIYIFRFDAFGRVVSAKRDCTSMNIAVIAGYTRDENGGAIVTLYDLNKGSVLNIGIDERYEEEIIPFIDDINSVPLEQKIAEYRLKTSTGKLVGISIVYPEVRVRQKYAKAAGNMGVFIKEAAAIIDATEYTNSMDMLKKISIDKLSDGYIYDAITICVNNSAEADFVILTKEDYGEAVAGGGNVPALDGYSFAVIAADFKAFNQTVIDGERVYKVEILENEERKTLYIPSYAEIYRDGNITVSHELRVGSAVYYKSNEDGLAKEIHIVLTGLQSYDSLLQETNVFMSNHISLPSGSESYNPDEWGLTLDTETIPGNNKIQMLLAPVCQIGDGYVAVAPIESDYRYMYANTNNMSFYTTDEKTNITAFDVSGNSTGVSRFSKGEFRGIDLKDTHNGYAYLGNFYDYFDFSYIIQPAFMVVVNGVVKEAVVFNN